MSLRGLDTPRATCFDHVGNYLSSSRPMLIRRVLARCPPFLQDLLAFFVESSWELCSVGTLGASKNKSWDQCRPEGRTCHVLSRE